MKEKEYVSWAELRDKGRNRFILVTGVLSFGIPMFIVMSFLVNKPFEHGFTVANVSVNLGIWLVSGLVFGGLMWSFNEKRFLKEIKNRESE